MSKREQLPRLQQLLRQQRWAALATLNADALPEASMVAYALNETAGEIYLHLSTLAGHTRNLVQQPRASLVISENDEGMGDPQQLARATLSGHVSVFEQDADGYENARQHYLAHLPSSHPLFDFGDFRLFKFCIEKIRFVGGFAQAHSYRPEELKPANQEK